MQRRGLNARLSRRQAEHLVLAGPFGRPAARGAKLTVCKDGQPPCCFR